MKFKEICDYAKKEAGFHTPWIMIPVGHKYVGSNPLENTLRFNLTYMMGKKKS